MEWKKLLDFGSKTILLKILTVFMLVITPLCILSLFIHAKGASAVKREIDTSLHSRTTYFVNTLEAEINRMIQHQREFILDKDLQKLVYISDTFDNYEWGETILRIQEKMKIIKTSSDYIDNVNAQLVTSAQSISSAYALGFIDQTTIDSFLAHKKSGGSSMMFEDGRLRIGLAYPNVLLEEQHADYIVFIELSVRKLQRALQQLTHYEKSGAVLISTRDGWSIANQGSTEAATIIEQLEKQPPSESTPKIKSIYMSGEKYIVSSHYSPQLDMALVMYVPEKEVLGDLNSYRMWYWVLAVFSMFIIAIFSIWIYRVIHKPLNKLVFAFRKVEDGYLEPTFIPKGKDEFRYIFENFNSMVGQIKELIHKLYEHEIRTKNSELKQLQSQINPHFLYNTYFILHRLAKMDDIENVILFSQYLGEYFQFITRNNDSQISLEQEMKHARLYVQIQQIRFSNRIEVEFDPLPDSFKECYVPKLIVQPIIENAYKYGMERKRDDGLITVSILCDDFIRIVVEDNGPGMEEEALHKLQEDLDAREDGVEITGIHNVHRRLRFLFGEGSGIRLSRGESGGLRVEIRIKSNAKMTR